MSETFTLTIVDPETPGQAPSHESAHVSMVTAAVALEMTLHEAGIGDRAVPCPQDWSDRRQVFNLIDVDGKPVGAAVIERD